MRGEDEIDPNVDPPPHLVIEVDISSPSLDRLPTYAHFGVPEVWRYDGERVIIYELRSTEYAEVAESLPLPLFTGDVLTRFVKQGLTTRRTSWMRRVREWARENTGSSG